MNKQNINDLLESLYGSYEKLSRGPNKSYAEYIANREAILEHAKQALLTYLLEGKPEDVTPDTHEVDTHNCGRNRTNAAWERHIRGKFGE